MASSKDNDSRGLLPPPSAASRRRSPITAIQDIAAPIILEQPHPPPIPPRSANIMKNSDDAGDNAEIGTRKLTDKESGRKTMVGKSNSLFSKDSAPVHSSTEMDSRFSLPAEQSASSGFHPDLEGLDFSGGSAVDGVGDSRPRSASMEDLKDGRRPIYPDISHVFRDIKAREIPSPTQFMYAGPPYPNMSMVPGPVGGSTVRPHPAPPLPSQPPIGWLPPVFNNTSSNGNFNNSSANGDQNFTGRPLTNNSIPGFPSSSSAPYPHGFEAFPRPASQNVYPASDYLSLFKTNSMAGFQSDSYDMTNRYATAAYDINPINNINNSNTFQAAAPSQINYMPNIMIPRPSSTSSIQDAYRESVALPPDSAVAGFDESFVPGETKSSTGQDLIQLGQTLPEYEYLSLDYFDPLYHRARQESFSVSNSPASSGSNKEAKYSFGEAFPNLYEDHAQGSNSGTPAPTVSAAYDHKDDEHIWLPNTGNDNQKPPPIGFEAFDFDAFGHQKFGTSEEEFLKGNIELSFVSPAYDTPLAVEKRKSAEKPKRPPSWKVPRGEKYERLRKRTFIDPESESFCQMVADLKKHYLSTDEKTNKGFLINQIRECHMGSIQVKVIVHTKMSPEPVAFTCDTSTLVEHVISHVIYTLSPTDTQTNTDEFILKVYDRTEYLSNDLPLAKFDYTHCCLKLDQDVNLELMSCQEVIRPFIRTRDDDVQMLYFPKEYINADGTAISQDALAVLIDTFYHEVDVLLEHFTKGSTSNFHTQGLRQSVKALSINLAKVETVEISKALEKLDRNVADLECPSSTVKKMYGSNSQQDKDTQDAINVAVRCSLVEDLETTVDQLIQAVKRLIRMYCRTFLTDFFLGSSIEVPQNHLEVVKVQDNFIVCISSAHRMPSAWVNKFEEYKIVCSLYHGTKRLIPDISTSVKPLSTGLCQRINWDEWLQFEQMYLCTLPRETRLCLMLCGIRTAQKSTDKNVDMTGKKLTFPLGAAAIQLFNEKGYLNQGPQLIPLIMGASLDPIMPSCKTLLHDSVLLQVNLPDFERTIFFPEPLNSPNSPTRSFDTLTSQIRSIVTNVMEKESCSTFTAEEFEILWTHRHYMIDYPSLLPRILQAAHSWDWASLSEIYSLLRSWKPLHPMQAFELLLPQFPDLRVRQFAADSLNKIPTDDLVDFLPQMIQGLKFESYHNSPLAKLLLEQSCKSPRFAHQFFWLLKGAASQDATFKRRYELMFVALASVAGDALYQEFKKQEELVKVMTHMAERVKAEKDKDATLKRELVPLHEMLEQKGRILLPYNPSVEVVGLDMKSCSYFISNTFPLKLVFKNSNPKADSHYVIYKVGDDLRQDMLTLQMIRIMDNLWLQQGLDLKIITFACLATGPKKGVIELITESDTLRKIQVSCGVTGSFKDRPIKEWLQKHNPTELEYKKAVENFTYSCAGYCVATYVLGVCDRHNDNIMLKQSGHMFHIDFSKFLGDAQMFGNFKRDRVPFVLTSDMAYVINDGGRPGHKFQHFIDLCSQAFNILRKHADLFRSLFILMARSGIPGVTEEAVQYVQNALLPGFTDEQATATFTRMIEESMKSVFTQFNFFIHNLAQLKFSSHNEGALLSFVPKSYSKVTDGKIASVELHGYQKRYTPEKHYIFILKIERENQKVPMYIFRHFSEFVEFRDKLNEMFPLVTWPNFSTRVVIGRSNIRTVAESRKNEINNFLSYLLSKTPEISQCDLVYTFFHPLLRDEQEAEKNKLNVIKLKETLVNRTSNTGNSGIRGEIKLSIQHKRGALQVMVMHVRGLPEGSELPSPYVKTYLLPDPSKETKLKTKTVKNSSHPTYNELLQYELSLQELSYRILQVTVWDRDMLKENNFLGAVYIKLRDLDLAKDNTTWHKLGRIQMPDF